MVLGIPKKILIAIAVVVGIGIIYVMGADKRASEASGGGGPTGCRMTVTADVLNVRSQPADNAQIVGKFKQDAQTDAHPVVQNGFRMIAQDRWAATEFLKPMDGANCG
ncbi:SH3 domain-containing protein [Amycolatopsis sp. 195334CR]|uniref:SH3 domain-containing protein n=1 Tax=Amycolatopsis sp. 195334CR TaxID=2814588 RepID=UPI001A8CE3DB|nr:SH3 domain-containing protein [Amycolatopsis sp. 195334CR]MBN6036487.1 SH3 domain-containing protein [Amycolatopsis sp. 195334CR]